MPETAKTKRGKLYDDLGAKAGWTVQAREKADLSGGRGVATPSDPLKIGHGFADYLLYVDGKAAGVIEATNRNAGVQTGSLIS